MHSSSNNFKSIINLFLINIFVKLQVRTNNISQDCSPKRSLDIKFDIFFFLYFFHNQYKQKLFYNLKFIHSNSNIQIDMLKKLKELAGTPAKKVKLNQFSEKRISTNDDESQNLPLISNMVFVRNISKKQSCYDKSTDQIQVNPFQFNKENQSDLSQKGINNQNMQAKFNYSSQLHIASIPQQFEEIPKKLRKKLTATEIRMDIEYDNILEELTLSKNNSTFPLRNQIELEQLLGDNIYINQLVQSHKQNIQFGQANKLNIQQIRLQLQKSRNNRVDVQGRLMTDYQIKQNKKSQFQYKQAYLCLNKLQKIFYFVKKLSFSQESQPKISCKHNKQCFPSFQLVKRLSNDQIRLFTRDTENHLIRYYQEWVENKSLFMIFQISSYTLADKNQSNCRLSQSQIWSLITECAESLKWIYSKNAIHLNIKPGNILKCRNKFKLADPFVSGQNFKELFDETSQNSVYTDPNIIKFIKYLDGFNFIKSDIYSLGMCVIQNVLNLSLSVMTTYTNDQIKKMLKKHSHGYSPYLIRLLIKMVNKSSSKRPQIQQLCNFMSSISYTEQNGQKSKLKLKRNYSL